MHFLFKASIYIKEFTMIISKRILIESVLRETTIDDVLNPEWETTASSEMDNEFFADKTALFWQYVEKFLNKLKSSSPEDLQRWGYSKGLPAKSITSIVNSIGDIDMAWVRHWLNDRYIYSIMAEDEMDSENPQLMHKLAVIELSHLLYEKL